MWIETGKWSFSSKFNSIRHSNLHWVISKSHRDFNLADFISNLDWITSSPMKDWLCKMKTEEKTILRKKRILVRFKQWKSLRKIRPKTDGYSLCFSFLETRWKRFRCQQWVQIFVIQHPVNVYNASVWNDYLQSYCDSCLSQIWASFFSSNEDWALLFNHFRK